MRPDPATVAPKIRGNDPMYELAVQNMMAEVSDIIEGRKEHLRDTLLTLESGPLGRRQIKDSEHVYLSLCAVTYGLQLMGQCRLKAPEEDELRLYQLLALAIGTSDFYSPQSSPNLGKLLTWLRPSEFVRTENGPLLPEELGNLWQSVTELGHLHGLTPPEDEVRDLLLPAPLEDHNVLWPPLDLLATSPLSGDVQPLTEHGAPNYQLLGLVLNELLQLAELPYAHVPNLFSAAGYLAATTTLDYENGQRYKRLLRQVQDVTGPIRTEYFRPHLSLPSQEAPLAREYAVQVLRTMKATHQKHGSAAMHQFREDIWDAFEELDELLQTPHPLNQVVSWTLGMKALLMFHRAPGMPVSAETEIGVNLTGLSPDFAWREISYGSQHELMCAIEMLENYSAILKKSIQLDLDARAGEDVTAFRADRELLCDSLKEASLEMAAILRTLGVSQPQVRTLLDMFTDDGNLSRITPQWSAAQANTLVRRSRDARVGFDVETFMWANRSWLGGGETGVETDASAPPPANPLPALLPGLLPVQTQTRNTGKSPKWSPDVLQLRELLRGGHVLLIGGEVLSHHHRALQEAFEADIEWIPSDRYSHGQQAAVRLRPGETRLAIVAIRWVSHAQSELRDSCKALGIPCLMHPAGLNPVSIAYHALGQVGGKLAAAGRSSY